MLKMRYFSELLSFCHRNMSRSHKQWRFFVKFLSGSWNIREGFQMLRLETINATNACFILSRWALFKNMYMLFVCFTSFYDDGLGLYQCEWIVIQKYFSGYWCHCRNNMNSYICHQINQQPEIFDHITNSY